MGDYLTATVQLAIENCCACGTTFAMERGLNRWLLDHPRAEKFYCPRGHEQWYTGKSDEQVLREKLEQERARSTHLGDQLAMAERSAAATRGAMTRLKKRVSNGVCPFCKRHFADVQAHMESKHTEHHDG